MSFFTELKRRNVFRVGVAYAIVAWLLIQIIVSIEAPLHLPDWSDTLIIVFLIIGFPAALFLAWVYELTPEGIKVTSSGGPTQYHTRTTSQRLNYFIIGVLVMVVAFLAVDNYVLKESPEGIRDMQKTTTITEPVTSSNYGDKKAGLDVPTNSIAVLPFVNISDDASNEYFSDGITEELLSKLSKLHGLHVAGRTSSFFFKGRDVDLRAIGDKLNVAHVLEGSVRKDGDRVRITTQLIKVDDGFQLWSDTYNRTLDDIFAVQDDIANSVANVLEITLGVGEFGQVAGMTRDIAAYDAYLAGLSLYRQPGRENFIRAIEKFEQAVNLDPAFAIAWGRLAIAYNFGAVGMISDASELIEKSDAATSQAMAIAPEAHASLISAATQQLRHRGWIAAEQYYQQALKLAPADYDTNSGYGLFLRIVGRPSDAIPYLQRAVQIEPLVPGGYGGLGTAYQMIGRRDAAVRSYQKLDELSNLPSIEGDLILMMEDNNRTKLDEYASTIVNAEPDVKNNRDVLRKLDATILPLLDSPRDVADKLRQFIDDPVYGPPAYQRWIAVWASYLGEHEVAIHAFLTASESQAFAINMIWIPIHKETRRQPGFKDVVRKLKFEDYWRTTGNWGDFCHPVGNDDFECE